MTVRINKPAFNIREKLSELERPIGLKGSELMKAETAQEARDLVSAGRKNMIINGAMQVAQRSTSEATGTVPNANSTYYTCDRWHIFGIGSDNAQWTNSQSTDTPTGVGFGNSWKWDCTTADASPAANARQEITQIIESRNLQHLRYGTSNPEEITVSFWVKATKTGKNYCWMYQYDGADFIAHKYYINQSNTWEKKIITFKGNTAAAIANDSTAGMGISWFLYAGSNYTTGTYQENKWRSWTSSDYNQFEDQTNHADSTSNDFYITEVQLEVGKNATEFEHRSYAEELALCQRYYWQQENFLWLYSLDSNHSYVRANIFHPVEMRAAPTVTGTFSNAGTATGFQSVTRKHTIPYVNGPGSSLTDIQNGKFDAEY